MKEENKKNKESLFSLKSVRRKLGWGFGVLIFLIVLFIILTYNINKTIQTDAQFIRDVNGPLNVMVEQVIGYDAILTGHAHAALLHSMKGELAGVAQHKKLYDEAGLKLDSLLKVEAKALINKSRRSLEDKQLVYGYLKQLDEINLKLVDLETKAFAAMEKGNSEEAYSLIVGETYHEYKETLLELYHKWGVAEAEVFEYYGQRILINNLRVGGINEIFGMILIIISIIIPILIFKTVVKPIDQLTEVVEEISSGNLNSKISNKLKKDKSEIGELARVFEKLHESSRFALKTLIESKMAKKYETLYTSSKDAIMVLEPPKWNFTSGNPAALKIFNVKNEREFISLRPGDLSPEKQSDGQLSSTKSRKMIDKAMKEGSNFFKWTHKRYKGENFPATVLLSKVSEGGKTYLQATVRDLTKTKE